MINNFLSTLVLSFLVLISHSAIALEKPPVTFVIFGATGDLSAKKLFPAVYNLHAANELNENFSLIAIGNRSLTEDDFQQMVQNSLNTYSRNQPTKISWEAIKSHLSYHQMDFTEDAGYAPLIELINKKKGNEILFYLATEARFFSVITSKLHENKTIKTNDKIVIEKPFGHDLESAIALQNNIGCHLNEEQIYRIDHYLGKEGVRKFINLRFQDSSLEKFFHKDSVDNIQMTLSESIGIGTRASFYENTGHLRDVVQNHAMQLLGIVLMDAKEYSEHERIQALEAICPFPPDQISQHVQRGQYRNGLISGNPVVGYTDENGVPAHSQIETFVQLKLFTLSDRWKGVPIYIRTGKRLEAQTTQIVLNLKKNPDGIDAITLVIQPHSQIYLTRGNTIETYAVDIDSAYATREAYENLLLAAIHGNKSDFVSMSEVLATWRLLTPLLHFWTEDSHPIETYAAGQWGTESADKQLHEEGIKDWTIILNDHPRNLLNP